MDFLGCWLVRASCLKSGCDEDAAEGGGHVAGGWLGLGGVPGGVRTAFLQVRWVVADGGVPGDGDSLAGDLERDRALDGAGGPVAGLPGAEDLLGIFNRYFDGLITNDKFCCVRRLRLSLSWWHRPLRLRGSVLQSDVALVGVPDEPVVDRLPPARSAPRRRAPVGSGLPAVSALGGTGRFAGPGADRRGGA